MMLATAFGLAFQNAGYFWPANGILLAYLLLAPRRSWLGYLAAGLSAHLAVLSWIHALNGTHLLFAPHDAIEVIAAAFLLRRRSKDLPTFTNGFYLVRFFAGALLLAPLGTALFYAAISAIWLHATFAQTWLRLFVADALGFAVTTPGFVAVFTTNWSEAFRARKTWLVFPVLAAIFVLLIQTRIPGPPLIFPALVLTLIFLGLGWASLLTLFAIAFGAWGIVHHLGPFATFPGGPVAAGIRLQLSAVSMMSVLYGLSVVIETQRNTERNLQRIAHLHATVAANSRDVILLIDGGTRNIIAAPHHFWGGWTRDDLGRNTVLEMMHPTDRENTETILRQLRSSDEGAVTEARVRRPDGTYAWIEASLRAVRDPISKAPTGVLANIREITDRKRAEQQLQDAFQSVEALSLTDPLTGLANRRRFDLALAVEWARAQSEQTPLSLLLIDADYFKRYNDIYGHPGGDFCLRQIAIAVRRGAPRITDLPARIGGEEFAVLLPNCSEEGAFRLANEICEFIRAQAIPHAGNPADMVTVSVGFGTAIPRIGEEFSILMTLADQALYAAKHAGRNNVYPSSPMCAYAGSPGR